MSNLNPKANRFGGNHNLTISVMYGHGEWMREWGVSISLRGCIYCCMSVGILLHGCIEHAHTSPVTLGMVGVIPYEGWEVDIHSKCGVITRGVGGRGTVVVKTTLEWQGQA